MAAYPWPGNIRELQHVVERSVLLAQEESIRESDLQLVARAAGDGAAEPRQGMTLDEAEAWFIQQALTKHQGRAADAAKDLGISRSALYRRLGRREPL